MYVNRLEELLETLKVSSFFTAHEVNQVLFIEISKNMLYHDGIHHCGANSVIRFKGIKDSPWIKLLDAKMIRLKQIHFGAYK